MLRQRMRALMQGCAIPWASCGPIIVLGSLGRAAWGQNAILPAIACDFQGRSCSLCRHAVRSPTPALALRDIFWAWKGRILLLQGLRDPASKVEAKAAANLAFLQGLAGDHQAAETCADSALEEDHYSAIGLVNKVRTPPDAQMKHQLCMTSLQNTTEPLHLPGSPRL